MGLRGSREQGPRDPSSPHLCLQQMLLPSEGWRVEPTKRRGRRRVRLLPRPVGGGAEPPRPPAGVLCLKAARGRVVGGRAREELGPGAAPCYGLPRGDRAEVTATAARPPLPHCRPSAPTPARLGRKQRGAARASPGAAGGEPCDWAREAPWRRNPDKPRPLSALVALRSPPPNTVTSCRPRQAADCLFCHLMDVEP